MFKTLYAKLASVLVVLLCLLGALYIVLTIYSTRLYFQEVNQRLNRTLAENLIYQKGFEMSEGAFDEKVLKSIFETYMAVNVSIEVYLLDPAGRILSYSAPPGKVKRTQVNLAPVRDFLERRDTLPILGDDPRDSGREKIFSAAPIGPADNPHGYLYVVLASEEFDSVAHLLEGSFVLKLSTWTLLATLVVGIVAGLALFYRLTRRLRRLDATMGHFQQHQFEQPVRIDAGDLRPNDELGRLSQTFNDMSGRIIEQMRVLKETDSLRRDLVANVSHDLRTPITSLRGYLETLLLKENELTPEQRKEYIVIAIEHSERLSRLVEELFELAKLDSGQAQLRREPFSIGELVQDVAMKFRLSAERNGVHLELNIPAALPFVDADIGLIERVLENLLDNAIRHTPRDGKVGVQLVQVGEGVRVEVSDTGRGIAPEHLPHVFDRFYQVDKTHQKPREGVGLGLAIASRILELHASTIRVASRLGAGTSFDFELPAQSV